MKEIEPVRAAVKVTCCAARDLSRNGALQAPSAADMMTTTPRILRTPVCQDARHEVPVRMFGMSFVALGHCQAESLLVGIIIPFRKRERKL
jgi:hypothetical protein